MVDLNSYQNEYARLPRANGLPVAKAVIKTIPDDFRVFEIPGFDFSGDGEHLCLQMTKQRTTTGDVVLLLASVFEVPESSIGYFGLKDKLAITSQWFSLWMPGVEAMCLTKGETALQFAQRTIENPVIPPDKKQQSPAVVSIAPNAQDSAAPSSDEPFVVLQSASWHNRKIKIGTHAANRFELTIRELCAANQPLKDSGNLDETAMVPALQPELIDQRLTQIASAGFPNYFTEQRFGIGFNNVVEATKLLCAGASRSGRGSRKVTRTKRSMYLSSARAYLFNQVLGGRIDAGDYCRPLPGEALMLAGSRSFFTEPADEESNGLILERIRRLDLHTTGPLWGRPDRNSLEPDSADFLRVNRERKFLDSFSDLRDGLENAAVQMDRRSLRATVNYLEWKWLDSSSLAVSFALPPGSYATAMLRELFDYRMA